MRGRSEAPPLEKAPADPTSGGEAQARTKHLQEQQPQQAEASRLTSEVSPTGGPRQRKGKGEQTNQRGIPHWQPPPNKKERASRLTSEVFPPGGPPANKMKRGGPKDAQEAHQPHCAYAATHPRRLIYK